MILNSILKIALRVLIALTALLIVIMLLVYYFLGINLFTVGKQYSANEINKYAQKYDSKGIWLIKKDFFATYGNGRFPKYKVFNKNGFQIDVYPCYEAIPDLLKITNKNSDSLTGLNFKDEWLKIRGINNGSIQADKIFDSSKYNVIFYYKNSMDLIQSRTLAKVYHKDSFNFIFVNVDKVNF